MYCTNCGNQITLREKYCARCGEATHLNHNQYCFMCGEKLSPESEACVNCGTRLIDGFNGKFSDNDSETSAKNDIENETKKKKFEIVNAVKSDLETSETAKIIKNKTKKFTNAVKEKSKKPAFTKKKKKIAIILAAVTVVLVVGLNIHVCEECDNVYFGKKYSISLFGEHEDVCRDCHDDFYCW